MANSPQSDQVAAAGLQPVLSLREKLGYGSGDVGFNLLFDVGQLYLLKFFTDALGINPAIAGTVFLVAKIWDAFADVAIGTWVDNRTKFGKRGKYRAFIFYATIPLALTTIATFQVPNFSLTGRTIWAFGIYMVFGSIYSLANIPYGALVPAITRNLQERAVLSSLRQGGGWGECYREVVSIHRPASPGLQYRRSNNVLKQAWTLLSSAPPIKPHK